MKKEEIIIITNVSKKFKIGSQKNQSTLMHFIALFSGVEPKKNLWALKNISLNIKPGERIGIIGRNGSGKTTLLRLMAGIYNLDGGQIKIYGKLIFISNTSLLKPRLTTKDNTYLLGSIFGLSRKDIKKKFNEIITFADLQNFIHTKTFQFSSGMSKKLNFSIAMHCVDHFKPDIILFDEILSGGADENFKRKSLKKIEELINNGMTIILVSHKLPIIKKYCNRAIWLDRGEIIKEGNPKEVVAEYLKLNS